MAWFSHNSVDPSDMEARYSLEDGLSYLDSVFSEPSQEDLELIDQVKEVLGSIPPREADFIELYYFKKLKQTDIAKIFGVSQPTVCYRLVRAAARVRFLLDRPVIDREKVSDELARYLEDPLDVQILLLMWDTTCQSETANILGTTQGMVRHRFLRALEKLRQAEHMAYYVELFEFVGKNLNILREVQRYTGSDSTTFCFR